MPRTEEICFASYDSSLEDDLSLKCICFDSHDSSLEGDLSLKCICFDSQYSSLEDVFQRVIVALPDFESLLTCVTVMVAALSES